MQKTWKINEIRNGESVPVAVGVSHEDAVRAIRAAMYGKNDILTGTARADAIHEAPLAA